MAASGLTCARDHATGYGAIIEGMADARCKIVVDREGTEGFKGNRGNQGTTINPLIFMSK